MTRKMLLLLSLAAGLVLAGHVARAEGGLKKVSCLTNYVFNGRHSPFFVGREKGFYKEAGFDIQIAPASGSGFVVTAVEGGKADYGMADPSSIVKGIAQGAKIKAYQVFMDQTTTGLASIKPYPTVESLKGASIAASLTDSVRIIIPIVFKTHGLDPDSIKWQTADPSVYFTLLMSGQADLMTATIDGDVPALQKLAGPQGKTVYFGSVGDWGWDVFGFLMLTQSDRIAQHPDEVKAFAGATAKAVLYSMEHPEETAKIMVAANPALNYDVTLTQWKQSIKAIDTAFMKEHGYGVATPERVERTIDLVKQVTKLTAPLKADDVFAQGFAAK